MIGPLLSIGITGYVTYNIFRNLGQSLKILLQGTPAEVNVQEVQTKLEKLPAIKPVHDLHVWSLDGTNHILTFHAVVDAGLQIQEAERVKQQIRTAMADMDIKYVTVELEAPGQECSLLECSA